MCGIAGHLRRHERGDGDICERQLRVQCHRGPDAVAAWTDGPASIGQTRLSIIDLVTGDPPITTPDERICVAMNGEIYNYAALREHLLRTGHQLRTTGDTEVVAHLAETLEPVELARSLHGMFAFAVWDRARRRLVLVRDRFGKKPLHWWSDGSTFVFGSEIKGVLTHPAVPASLDERALPLYLAFGAVPTPQTFYEGIQSLPPGHVATIDEDLCVHIEPYWQPTAPGRPDGPSRLDVSFDDATTLVRSQLELAVDRRLVADVPVGAFLSGGVDSSAVVAMMARSMSEPVRTFTIGFEDADGFDERQWARMVAERYATDHTEFVVHPRAVDLVDKLVWHHDQPFGDSSAIPTYLLSELTRSHVTVALCGDGGDEVFAGYERFAAGVAADVLHRVPATLLRPATRALALAGGQRGRGARISRFASVAAGGLPDAFRTWISYIDDAHLEQLTPGGVAAARALYADRWDRTAGASTLDRLLLLNLETYLVDDLLPKVDRTSMAVGLEVRAPFLDHELFELVTRLPPRMKARGMQLKRVLKAAVADLLPEEILHRPKHGFGVPLDRWFREDLATYTMSTLGAPDARLRAHVRGEALDELLRRHAAGRENLGHAIWTLLTLELFLRSRGW
jgi:asparagine synthase (glutamine-hydrolysing)